MKRIFFLLVLLALCGAPRASAQFTLVSGTVTDPNGLPWACGTISAQLVNNNGISATLNGVSFSASTAPVKLGCPTDPTTSRTAGFFQMQLADNTVIKCPTAANPAAACSTQTTWQFTANTTGILPPQGTGPQSFTQAFTISGASQTLSFSSVPTLSLGSSSSASTANFSFANLGGVDDDATDNCATGAAAAFNAAVNAYAGPGTPSVIIGPKSAASLAYRLSTPSLACHFEFDQPVNLTVSANVRFAQASTAENGMQFGAKGLGAQAFVPKSTVRGGGTFLGGAGLVNAGIEMEPLNTNTDIGDIQFFNFGAGNATLGACTNRAILFDALVFEGTVHNTQWSMTDSVAGRCPYANPFGASPGQNTVLFINNTLGGAVGPGFPPTTCSSVGIEDGGAFNVTSLNNIYGFAVDIRLQGIAARIVDNILDSASCANNGVNAVIQYGARAATTQVANTIVRGNQFHVGHSGFIAKAGDTLAGSSIAAWVVDENVPNAFGTGNVFADNTTCTPNTTTGAPCYLGMNAGLSPSATGAIPAGFVNSGGTVSYPNQQTQAANIGSTAIATAPVGAQYIVTCTIVLTRAATTSSTLPQCVIAWTDVFSGQAQSVTVTPAWASGTVGCSGTVTNTTGDSCTGSTTIGIAAAGTINVSTTGYASVGGTTMQFAAFENVTLKGN